MDTITHIVFGACIGEVIAHRQIGKKALIIGAVAQSVPDIDFIASFWLPTAEDLLAHRGFTHSLLFIALTMLPLAWVCKKLWTHGGMSLKKWTFFWGFEMFIHILLDAFNAYGTAWFEPFNDHRFSFNTMFVADPLFSIWLAVAFAILLFSDKLSERRMFWVKAALSISVMYWFLGVCNKLIINNAVRRDFKQRNIAVNDFFTTPTFFNNLLWYIVAQDDSGYYVGYRSVFDKTKTIDYHYVPRRDDLLKLSNNEKDKELLLRFAQGYYTAELWHDTLVLNVLRFGEMGGWADPDPRFAFYYYLQYPKENDLIVQRGRFAKWNKETITEFLDRIKGI